MTETKLEELHPDIEQARREFERWRRERTKRGPIPAELWEESIRLARDHGVQTVAQALGLHYTRLKAGVLGQEEVVESVEPSLSPAGEDLDGSEGVEFVELRPVVATPSPEQGEATIELSRADGSKLSIRLPVGGTGQDRLDLVAMTRAFLGEGICSR